MKENNRNFTLDLIRGVSALIVLSGHLRAALFKDFSELDVGYNASLIEKAFYFVTSLGHQAVMVFFVLSGYFVGGSVLKAKKSFKFEDYLIARLSRLWTPLIPILIVTFIIDYFIGIVSTEILVGNHYPSLMSGPKESYSASIITFFLNIFFLQTIAAPVYGSNSPLWSLANEFWYYILFPLIMAFVGVISKRKIKRFIYGLITLLIVGFISKHMMIGFLIWIMGVVVYIINEKKVFVFKSWFFILSLTFLIFSLVGSKSTFLGEFFTLRSDIFVGISFSCFLLSILNYQLSNLLFINLKKISYYISEISYTLYIAHFPLVLLIYALFYSENQLIFNGNSILQYLAWLILIVLLCFILWYFFERQTLFVRKGLKSFFKN